MVTEVTSMKWYEWDRCTAVGMHIRRASELPKRKTCFSLLWPAEWSLLPLGTSKGVTIAQRYCTFILPSETSCGLDPILWMTEITVRLIFLARPCYFVKAQTLLVGYAYLTRVLRRIMKHPHLLLSSPRVTVAEYTCIWEPTCACRLLVMTVSSFKWICNNTTLLQMIRTE
jgi:hypothetical protein